MPNSIEEIPFDLGKVRREVETRQNAALKKQTSFVVLDTELGAYVEHRPDGSTHVVDWCQAYDGRKPARLFEKIVTRKGGFDSLLGK